MTSCKLARSDTLEPEKQASEVKTRHETETSGRISDRASTHRLLPRAGSDDAAGTGGGKAGTTGRERPDHGVDAAAAGVVGGAREAQEWGGGEGAEGRAGGRVGGGGGRGV